MNKKKSWIPAFAGKTHAETNKKKFKHLGLTIIFLISLTVRGLFFHNFLSHNHNYMVPEDSAQYHAAATTLLTGQETSTHAWADKFHRLPGYPLILAGCYTFFGPNPITALWIQVFIASFIPILIYFLALTLFPTTSLVAFIAGLAASIHVGFITYAGSLMAESYFMIFFLLFLMLFLPQKKLFLAGILLGIASIIRPVGTPLLALSIFYLLFTRQPIKQKLRTSVSFFTGWVSITGLVLLRNYLACGALFFHTLPGIHFLRYSTASVHKEVHSTSFHEARVALANTWQNNIQEQEAATQQTLNEYQRCNVAEKITCKYFIEYPLISIKHFCINIIKTTLGLHASYLQFVDTKELFEHATSWGVWERVRIYFPPHVKSWFLIPMIYSEIIFLFLMLLGVLGFSIRACFSWKWFEQAFLTVPWAGLFIGLTLGAGCARLRLPADIFLIMLASCFWVKMLIFK